MPPPSPFPFASVPARGIFEPTHPLASGAHAVDFSTWGALEWIGYSAMALVCIWVLWRAVRTTVHPGEEAPDHVKRSILDDDTTPFGRASASAASARHRPHSAASAPPRN